MELCEYYLPKRCQIIIPSEDSILNDLDENKLILIPYDKDYNHEPVLLNGRKSHWAIILGNINLYIYLAYRLKVKHLKQVN